MYFETVKNSLKPNNLVKNFQRPFCTYILHSLRLFVSHFPNWFPETHKIIHVCTLTVNTSMRLWATHSFDFLVLITALQMTSIILSIYPCGTGAQTDEVIYPRLKGSRGAARIQT